MILSRQNLKGGKKLTGFPIHEERGVMGYKLGYCSSCNETILMCMQDRDELMAYFQCGDETYKEVKKLLNPKVPFNQIFRDWLIRWLGGQVASV